MVFGRDKGVLAYIVPIKTEDCVTASMPDPEFHPATLNRSELQGVLFARNPEPMWVYDNATLQFYAVNDAAIARYGYTEAEFLTMTLADIRPAEEVAALRLSVADLPEGPHSSGIWRHRSNDGTLFWADTFSQSVNFENKSARLVTARDATNKHQIDEEIRLLTETMSDIVSLLDTSGCYLYVSPSIFQATGYSVEEVLGTCVFDACHPDDLKRTQQDDRRIWLTKDCYQIEWRRRCKDGSYRWFETRATQLPAENGQPDRLLCETRDIEQRKVAEEALCQERRLTEAIVETSGTLIFVMDRTGRIVRFNRACEELTGYQSAEVVGQEFLALPLRPGETSVVQLDFGSLCAGPFPSKHERTWITRNGQERQISWANTALRDNTGEVEFIIATGHDVTEQRQIEDTLRRTQDQYRSIFENAIEGIFQSTRDGKYLSVNPALARIYGYQSPEDLITHLDDIAQGLYIDTSRRDDFVSLMYADGIVVNFESQVRCKDGSPIWINESAHTVCDADGTLLYYEGMVEDITERKALEAERERMLTEALARADRDPLTGLLNHRAFHKRLEESPPPYTIALLDLDNFGFFNDVYGHAVGDDLLRRVAAHLENFCESKVIAGRYGGDEFALLIPGKTGTCAAPWLSDCLDHLSQVGYRPPGHDSAIPLHLSVGLAAFPDDGMSRADVLHIADERLLRVKTGGDSDAPAAHLRETLTQTFQGFSMLDALVTAVDNKDRYTRRHSEDVMTHCLAIAREMGLDAETQDTLAVAALLHDVGKIGVPDHILRKPGHLTEDEFAAIKHHPLMGAVIVGAVSGFEKTLDAVRHHHERWDGDGYPYGLRGEETPLLARLMAIADAYSAMTTDRPYRKGMPPSRDLTILEEGMGTQWDPKCVRAFLQVHRHNAPTTLMAAA
jgi:diguanylate cyclase (GGDEF)-like protein/PAS domain S-box-containing protein